MFGTVTQLDWADADTKLGGQLQARCLVHPLPSPGFGAHEILRGFVGGRIYPDHGLSPIWSKYDSRQNVIQLGTVSVGFTFEMTVYTRPD